MNIEVLKRVLAILRELKGTMHDTANTGAYEQLDQAIDLVEQCIKSGRVDDEANHKVLLAIGKFIELLPSIAALIKWFSE